MPIAGATAVSMFNEKAQAGLLFLDDLIALHAMDMYPKYSMLLPVPSANPRDVWDAFRGGRLGTSGPPKCLQKDERGEWENELWPNLRAGRRI